MKVLVACEFSGIVAKAFRVKGHEAYSCDIIPGDIPEFHLQIDLFKAVSWLKPDLLIAHPPCTYLCKAQIWRIKNNEDRAVKMLDALWFVKQIWNLQVKHICIENPIGLLPKLIGTASQIIYPWWFGDKHSKDICLWLKNLPPLIATCYNTQRIPVSNHVNGRMSQAQKSHIKSKFFPLVADAMATQWS